MTILHSTALRNAMANAITAYCDGVVDPLSPPVNPTARIILSASPVETAPALATLIMSNPSFGEAVAGAITANAIRADQSAVGGGTAAFFRIVNRYGNTVLSGTVSDLSGTGDIKLSQTSIAPGDTVAIASITYKTPN